MKNLLFLLFFAPALAFAHTGNPNLDVISKALSTGDVETLSKYFADNIEVSIQDNEQTYTKAQATDVVRTFFNTNKPKGFDQVHQGTSRENSDQYCIGNLTALSGKYRVYIYMKSAGTTLTIKELRFDKE
jgi:Domain of unknown function (DUF4783)